MSSELAFLPLKHNPHWAHKMDLWLCFKYRKEPSVALEQLNIVKVVDLSASDSL